MQQYQAEVPEYKVVVLGGGGVGKSTLTIRLLTDNFLDEYDPTIEDSYRKQICLQDANGKAGKPVLLDILDTAGQEEFKSMRDQWIREGDGFLLVYSITSAITFEEIQSVREHILQNKDCEFAPIVIAGNKCDLEENRQVSKKEALQLAQEWNCPFFETSAKSKKNNIIAFHQVVHEIMRYQQPQGDDDQKKKKKKKLACAIL
mmetsp:Transcript_24495/g.38760  ORF Transcript_24495/g.38760 Transcript_24495/m.38760 type:complete len:203 (-) Transcript_24495:381-989(-)